MSRNLLEPWKDIELTDLPNEVWKDVVGFSGLYEVSNLGRVKSVERTIYAVNGQKMNILARILKQSLYIRDGLVNSANVALCENSKHKSLGVSIIVGEAFLGRKKKNEIYCHLNKNPFDNRVKNLQIMSRKKSSEINIAQGRHKFVKDFMTNPVYINQRYKSIFEYHQIDPDSKEIIGTYTRKEITDKYSWLAARIIEKIGKGERVNKIHLGFIWERKEIEE